MNSEILQRLRKLHEEAKVKEDYYVKKQLFQEIIWNFWEEIDEALWRLEDLNR